MEPGHASTVDESKAHGLDHQGERRYLSGLVDEIGDRFLILDERPTPTFEVLRFRQTLTTSPGFEVALRRRVERLRHFRHPAFAETPTVEYVGGDRRLGLLSNYRPGRRLSDLLAYGRDPVLAASLIHQLTPALEALNEYGEGVGHGALTASRIVSAPDGQLIITEHVLGSAVARLHLTATASRRDLGIPLPATDTGYPPVHGPTDCFQLALVAVSMLLGRALSEDEYSDVSGALNAALAASDQEYVEAISVLRIWLSRALQVERGFLTLREAVAALREVTVPDSADIARRWRAVHEASERIVGHPLPVNDVLWEALPLERPADVPPAADVPVEPVDSPPFELAESTQQEPPALPAAISLFSKAYVHTQSTHSYIRWAFVGLALCAILEAFVIARLLAGRGRIPPAATVAQVNLVTNAPGAPVMVDGRVAGLTPLDLSINSQVRSIKVGSSLTLAQTQELAVGSSGQNPNPVAIGRERAGEDPRPRTVPVPVPRWPGGIRVASPIELDVFEGDKRLGSTATGIVLAPAGRHEVDLINSVLGFRSRQVVDVRAGQIAAVAVSPPNGRININAVPWAEVLIDGKSIGETPIGNLSIPLGEHEIVFRHPQLGEVRRTAVVRSDEVTRVSANLER
jgi:PEGA domain-containing protein